MTDSHQHDGSGGANHHCHGRDHGHGHGHEHGHDRDGHHDHAHDGDHDGDHDHPHDGPHGHHAGFVADDTGREGGRSETLPRGAGSGRILYFDAFSGIAGDMTIAALVDLGVPMGVIADGVGKLGLSGYTLSLQHGRTGSLGACRFDVVVEEGHPQRTYREIDQLLAEAPLEEAVRDMARRIFRRLAVAEARVHRIDVEEVHFHEVGAIDAIVDIVGTAVALDHLGATVLSSKLPLSRGFVECRHGVIPLPAPATVECLIGVPTVPGPAGVETVTPTGAAIVSTVASSFGDWPAMRPLATGWGAGSHTLPDRPNLLRVVLGEPLGDQSTEEAGSHVVLEANVDDLTGEIAGHVIGLLIERGALDAWAVPITTKKGRPGLVLGAIAERHTAEGLIAVMLRETTTLGVRHHELDRTVRPRRMVNVSTRYGVVPVKVSEGPFGPPQLKPEFDVCARLSRIANVPVREVIAEALRSAGQNGEVSDGKPDSG
jgi:pyridinium-3,5-bisthiocarboxylic acid mononucleotide nickel chelatase